MALRYVLVLTTLDEEMKRMLLDFANCRRLRISGSSFQRLELQRWTSTPIAESFPVNGENAEVTQTFTYLGSVILSSTSCELDVN